MKKLLSKKGFTLIELIVVIAIIAILAAILIPSIITYITEAENSRDLANARSLYTAAVLELEVGDDFAAGDATYADWQEDGCDVVIGGGLVTSVTCNGIVFTP